MAKERKPDVKNVNFKDTVVVAGIHNRSYNSDDKFDVYWEGNPWITMVPKVVGHPTVVVPLSWVKFFSLA